jgi:hypothetical protein
MDRHAAITVMGLTKDRRFGGPISGAHYNPKSEIGRDQDEGRRDLGLKRHLILSAVSSLFLARVRQEGGGTEPGADGRPTAHGAGRAGPLVGVVVTAVEGDAAGEGGEEDHVGAMPRLGRAT